MAGGILTVCFTFGVEQWVEVGFEGLLDVDMLDLKVDPTSVGLPPQPVVEDKLVPSITDN